MCEFKTVLVFTKLVSAWYVCDLSGRPLMPIYRTVTSNLYYSYLYNLLLREPLLIDQRA